MDKLLIKEQLYQFCIEQIQKKLDTINAIINSAQNSANSETKSTAGDKHDTARAMAHLETEKNAKQLAEINKIKKIIPYLKSSKTQLQSTVQLGCVVETSLINYYISSNLGQIKIEDKNFLTISPISPLAKAFMGKKTGHGFNFNQNRITITDVF